MAQTYLITTAIDYVNSRPHLGTAYEKIAADCIARAHRRLGRDVRFVIGNDEHSTNVAKSAREQGMEPLAYCDRMEGEFREAWKRLDISFDDFIRTTEPRHRTAVQELLRRIQANGHVRKDRYEGWYCEGCEAFYTEKDLVGGLCPNHETKPKWVKEENFFFRLSSFQEPLLQHIRANPEFIRPETRRNEIVAFLESGLTDISISRAGVEWGIPFPDDPGHVVYVWFDALINYIAAAGFGTDDEEFARWWPADLHVIGKDITRFHCVIWPAMLLAAGLQLPATVFGHGFITHAGRKMSKSLGNIVSPLEVAEKAGADALRYFLLREVTFGKDGDFSWDTLIGRNNADLANDLGNLVQRTTDMTTKFLGGRIPEGADAGTDRTGLRNDASDAVIAAVRAYERLDLGEALGATWALIRRANQTVQETRPWEIAKDEARRAELGGVLADLLEAIRVAAVLVEPAMPTGARAILERLGLDPDPGPWSESTVWRERAAWAVGSGRPLFPRLEAPAPEPEPAAAPAASGKPAAAEKSGSGKKGQSKKTAAPPEAIEFADFQNVELLVATVKSAEPVEGADRLLRLQLDDGRGGRQVVAGIAEHFRPEDLPGRQIVLVANLKPAKIRGVESQGMILAARSGNEFVLLGPQGAIAPGARIS